jgi:formate dehydrogenase beta subunit
MEAHISLDMYRRERGYELIRRVEIPVLAPGERLADPRAQVEVGYGAEEALQEASRCLDCGITPVFDGTRCVLCGGCVDVCPTICLKLVGLDELEASEDLQQAIEGTLGPGADLADHSAIVKDEERCIRCALCAMRCPTEAITMERVTFMTEWSPA